MGRALVREPAVFLLDEPLSNLDAKLRVQVRAEIAELRRRAPTTMLYVTHDQVEALTLGDRVAVLERGRLQQVASPAELYARPANRFVAGFIGSPPMNFLPARLLPGARADGEIVAGVRPEALRLGRAGEADTLAATVEQVEALGHETLVHVRIGAADAALGGARARHGRARDRRERRGARRTRRGSPLRGGRTRALSRARRAGGRPAARARSRGRYPAARARRRPGGTRRPPPTRTRSALPSRRSS